MSFLLRVALPDRPGSLGALATALGGVGADIVSLDVVEHRGDGSAVDDILVELPLGRMADVLVTAAQSVPGVRVQFLRRYAGGPDLHRDVEAVEAMAVDPRRAAAILTTAAPGVFRADWAALVESGRTGAALVHVASAGAPDLQGLSVPWLPLDDARAIDTAWAPRAVRDAALVAVPLLVPTQALLVGRSGGPEFLPSELARLRHLAAIAASVASTAPETPVGQRG